MQNSLYLSKPGHIPTLCAHFGSPDTNFVLGDVPIGWAATRERDGLRIADLLVAFNVDRAAIIAAMGYSISEQGKPPDFVLEVASPTVARWDEIENPGDYADFGVPEYWRFDHEWGRNGTTGLAGDRLVNGVYHPITIYQDGPAKHWGYSAILDLDLCWEDGELRFYDPTEQRYLYTYDSMRAGRIAAEEARDAARAARIAAQSDRIAAEESLDTVRAARIAAEEARDAARADRIAAEEARDAARAARIAAESQISELQAEIARLRSGQSSD